MIRRRLLPSETARRDRPRSVRPAFLGCESLESRILLTAVRDLPGFSANALPEEMDASSDAVDIGFEIDFGGLSYDQLFVNENGNVTFGTSFQRIPTTAGQLQFELTLADLRIPIIAPFWADVDAVVQGSVTYGADQVDGRAAWGVSWTNVGYGEGHDDLSNDLQLVLIDRSDVAPGAFDIEFNFDQAQWETGDRSGGDNGMGGAAARIGYSTGSGTPGTFLELVGSGASGYLTDGGQRPLVENSLHSDEPGRYVLEVRSELQLWDSVPADAIDGDLLTFIGEATAAEGFLYYTLDEDLLEQILWLAPPEFSGGRQVRIQFPTADGNFVAFDVYETFFLSPEESALNPQFRSFAGRAADDPTQSVALDFSFDGVAGENVSTGSEQFLVDPFPTLNETIYAGYSSRTVTYDDDFEIADAEDINIPIPALDELGIELEPLAASSTNSQLRTYRLVVAATNSFVARNFNAALPQTNVQQARNAIQRAVNRANQIHLSPNAGIRLNLVQSLIFPTAATDPFAAGDGNRQMMINTGQAVISGAVAANQYDVGHTFGGAGGGGLASLGVVGDDTPAGRKARAVTQRNGPVNANFIQTLAHETGHQLNAGHTWSGDTGDGVVTFCSAGQFSSVSSVEPGSGTTIMSYFGFCGDDDIPNPSGTRDDYFHGFSIDQMLTFAQALPAAVGSVVNTPNTDPSVNAGSDEVIPARTPFELSAQASDPDGDALWFSWEQIDRAPAQVDLAAGDVGNNPLFRSLPPTQSNERVFPQLEDLIAGTTSIGETLPTTSRSLNFAITARDRLLDVGAIDQDELVLTVSDTGSPFRVVAPTTGTTWGAGANETVTWDVAGTDLAPISQANVDIFLSLDGGRTYPVTLALNVPNDGSQTVIVPNLGTNQARVKVKGTDNVFFNISDGDFRIIEVDRFEPNDTLETATVLGSIPEVTLRDLTIHSDTDVDYFQVTANRTGKLIVNSYFVHDDGNLQLEIRDANDVTIARSASFSDDERVIIPVVTQETYFVHVSGSAGALNRYALEFENIAAPVPSGIHLDPDSDTGMDPMDLKTADNTPRIFIQADLRDFETMFNMNPDPNPSGVIDANGAPGADVEVQITGVNTLTSVSGNATRVGTTTLWSFTPGVLPDDTYFVSAAVTITDGQQPSITGRTQLSEPIWMMVDTQAPDGGTIDLLSFSDTGMSNDDRVTNKMSPAFVGLGEANAKVRVFAQEVQLAVGPRMLVGQGVVHSDGSDGDPQNGLGIWEVTVEPLADAKYNFTAEFEDMAGNIVQVGGQEEEALMVWIDTVTPNTPHLDLITDDDTGRNNSDDITNVNRPRFDLTFDDTVNGNDNPFPNDVKVRIYDRPGNALTNGEVLIFDSFLDTGDFIDSGFLRRTLTSVLNNVNGAPLADGVHNLKMEVEDRAGNISHDFLLDVLIDTEAFQGNGNLHPDSDTGIWGFPETMEDMITSDKTPKFFGTAEANNLVIAEISSDGGQTYVAAGTTVAVPLDGDDGFQPPDPESDDNPANDFVDGNWHLKTILNLDDGQHEIRFTYEDVAGNRTVSRKLFFVDTEGPVITNVFMGDISIDGVFDEYDPGEVRDSLFAPKPSSGPDPLIHSVVIEFSDGPDRTPAFLYDALWDAIASEGGNYKLLGDANGHWPILEVNRVDNNPGPGPATAEYELVFHLPAGAGGAGLGAPLPDDRFTLWVDDSLADPAGNPLDGESEAEAPFEGVNNAPPIPPLGNQNFPNQTDIFPTGDGEHGGDFHARFTVDSRAELGVWAASSVWVDTNGNFLFDPQNTDFVNRDVIYSLAFTSDDVFAGNFTNDPGPDGILGTADDGPADGFDKLAAYGRFGEQFRWLIDTDNDGIPNVNRIQTGNPTLINALPAAGNFDLDATNGDEVALFTGLQAGSGTWLLDTTHSFVASTAIQVPDMSGYPVVGDFDGDGLDDLGSYTDDVFQIDFAADGFGQINETFRFGFIGVRERPVAADFDADGIDDLGLWVPDREGVAPREGSEWYILMSNGAPVTDRIQAPNAAFPFDFVDNLPLINFDPIPFGPDIYAQFGDEFALPVVGNFDPPVTGAGSSGNSTLGHTNPVEPLDVDSDGFIAPLDALLVLNYLNSTSPKELSEVNDGTVYLDVSGDLFISPLDALLVINYLNQSPLSPTIAGDIDGGGQHAAAAIGAERIFDAATRSIQQRRAEPAIADESFKHRTDLALSTFDKASVFESPWLNTEDASLVQAQARTEHVGRAINELTEELDRFSL